VHQHTHQLHQPNTTYTLSYMRDSNTRPSSRASHDSTRRTPWTPSRHVITNTLRTRRAHTHDQTMTWFIPTSMIRRNSYAGLAVYLPSAVQLQMKQSEASVNWNLFSLCQSLTYSCETMLWKILRCLRRTHQVSLYRR
jgi:hypothetical protein